MNLRELRKNNGYTRSFIANKINITPDYLNQIERGGGALPKIRVKKLAELYKCTADEIYKVWKGSVKNG